MSPLGVVAPAVGSQHSFAMLFGVVVKLTTTLVASGTVGVGVLPRMLVLLALGPQTVTEIVFWAISTHAEEDIFD